MRSPSYVDRVNWQQLGRKPRVNSQMEEALTIKRQIGKHVVMGGQANSGTFFRGTQRQMKTFGEKQRGREVSLEASEMFIMARRIRKHLAMAR